VNVDRRTTTPRLSHRKLNDSMTMPAFLDRWSLFPQKN
jgi:hypothetical protein